MINIMPAFLVRAFARPYVSGDSIAKGIQKAKDLWENDGISSTLDLLGEAVDTREMVEYNIETYHTLIKMLKDYEFATVSLKPTSLGIHESREYCLESMRSIMDVARENTVSITIDMEDHTFTDSTLDLYTTLLKEYPDLGTVLQSRMLRTEKDIENLKEVKARIRICIGIYNEPEEYALQKKQDMKVKLLEYAQTLLEDGHYVEFATHDIEYIEKMLDVAKEKGYTSEQLEFQQLLGVPMKSTQTKILDAGYKNRLYVPFATNWKFATPYLKRRLNNNPRMAWYVIHQGFKRIFRRS